MTNAHLQGYGVLRALLKLGNGVTGLGSDNDGALEAPTLSLGTTVCSKAYCGQGQTEVFAFKGPELAGRSLSLRFCKGAKEALQPRIDSNHHHELVVI